MGRAFERKESSGALTLKLYRGEGMALLAFDLEAAQATPDFVGFSIEVKYPGGRRFGALKNRLHFDLPPRLERPRAFRSTEAPFQKFRWLHVPSEVSKGEFRYRVKALYMNAAGKLRSRDSVEAAISLDPTTLADFVNVGFTRGFASSQAYAGRFDNEAGILPPTSAPAAASLDQQMAPFEEQYAWLGFEVRRLIYETLDEVRADPALTLDALIYESKEPEVLRRLEALGNRLRVIVDDHGDQAHASSAETLSFERLLAAGATAKRLHFGRQQHNKVLIVRRKGRAIRVLCGSTNFSLRGLYIQANNALRFDDPTVAGKFGEVFDAYWTDARRFRQNPLSQNWWTVRDAARSRVHLAFSPHSDSGLSLTPVADAIDGADSSVFYSLAFLNQITGRVRDALDDLMQRTTFSYGVAQRVGGLALQKPDGSTGLLPFAFLGESAPEPFRAEWNGNTTGHSNMVHHKFVVTDFNGDRPNVFTGSSNLAQGGEEENGDHVIHFEDRKVAIVYAIEALRLFDHFHFRVNARSATAPGELRLARPPLGDRRPWFAAYYRKSHVKERDRKLFVK